MFIEVTSYRSSNKISININKIISYHPANNNSTRIVMEGEDDAYYTKESYDEVKSLINAALLAQAVQKGNGGPGGAPMWVAPHYPVFGPLNPSQDGLIPFKFPEITCDATNGAQRVLN